MHVPPCSPMFPHVPPGPVGGTLSAGCGKSRRELKNLLRATLAQRSRNKKSALELQGVFLQFVRPREASSGHPAATSHTHTTVIMAESVLTCVTSHPHNMYTYMRENIVFLPWRCCYGSLPGPSPGTECGARGHAAPHCVPPCSSWTCWGNIVCRVWQISTRI